MLSNNSHAKLDSWIDKRSTGVLREQWRGVFFEVKVVLRVLFFEGMRGWDKKKRQGGGGKEIL